MHELLQLVPRLVGKEKYRLAKVIFKLRALCEPGNLVLVDGGGRVQGKRSLPFKDRRQDASLDRRGERQPAFAESESAGIALPRDVLGHGRLLANLEGAEFAVNAHQVFGWRCRDARSLPGLV